MQFEHRVPESPEAVYPHPEEVNDYQEELASVLMDEALMSSDPVLKPMVVQAQNHLKHVSFNFRIKGDAADYPYDLPRHAAFPEAHTSWAIARAERLLGLLGEQGELTSLPELSPEVGDRARQKQDELIQAMLANPLETYDDFTARRERDGFNASFPEMGWTIQALASDMVNKQEVREACAASPVLSRLRSNMFEKLTRSMQDGTYRYGESLDLIEDTMGFFDLVVRVNDPESPAPYHSARFEYNWHALRDDPDHTILPTTASLDLEGLIRLRGVPVGLIGISTDTLTVDGFPQTPYEFFHHDVDHTRRMHQEIVAAVEREGMAPRRYYEQATELMERLLPHITLRDLPARQDCTPEQQEEYDQRVARLVTLFEVLHEDAYDCTPDSIADALLRAPMSETAFERDVDGETIEYYTGPRASLLAHVYRKLQHTFYDLPESRTQDKNWSEFARTRRSIIEAASFLYRQVSDNPISDEDLWATCTDLISSDEGFTDAFIGNFAHDIRRRAITHDVMKLMVTRPLEPNAAIRRIHRVEFPGMKVHSLFGYAALEYEHPDQLEEAVVRDLTGMDPNKTVIAMGATPYGLNRLYPVIKELGFQTLGIVASKALGLNEETAEGVDRVVVVKDSNWGGYRYSETTKGLLSPTTRVFVGASDSIAAYGGGGITAVTIEEAQRRGIPVSYREFEMNHFIAKMLQAQHGNSSDIDYRGPAYETGSKLIDVA